MKTSEHLQSLEAYAQDGFRPPSVNEVLAERCRRSLSTFCQAGWSALEPDAPLIWELVHEVMADHIEELLLGWVKMRLHRFAEGSTGGCLPPVPTSRLPAGRKEREAEVRRRADLRDKHALGHRLKVLLRSGRVLHQPMKYSFLLINVGTGYGKSRLAHVFAPAWLWLQWPTADELACSINGNGVTRDAAKQKALVSGLWFNSLFRPWWGVDRRKDGDAHYRNTAGGERTARGWWAQVQGERGHLQLVDDPEDPEDVFSEGERTRGQRRWDTTWDRRVHAGGSIRLATQQRLLSQDWSAHVLATGEVEHLELSTEGEETPSPCTCPTHRRGHTALGWRDERAPGVLLAPRLVTPGDVESRRRKPIIYDAQDRQRPRALAGNIFRAEDWRFWRYPWEPELDKGDLVLPPPSEWATYFEDITLSADLSFGVSKDGSKDAIGVWGKRGEKRVLLAVRWDHYSPSEAAGAIRSLVEEVPQVRAKLIEKAAGGAGAVDALTHPQVPGMVALEGVIPVPASTSKVMRAISIQHLQVAGNLFLPRHHQQLGEMLAETGAFPKRGVRNDFVDQMTQALRYWEESSGFAFV